MDDKYFNTQMLELESAIADLPESEQDRLRSMAKETRDRHHSIRNAIERRQGFFENLNLAISYLVFDLEATKRENLMMRYRLEQDSGGAPEDGPA